MTLLEPTLDPAAIAQHIRQRDPRYFTTYYAIDAVNFQPVDVSSALPTLDAPYLPVVLLEAAGLPLDASFSEQKRILERCHRLVLSLQRRRGGAPLQPAADRCGADQGAVRGGHET